MLRSKVQAPAVVVQHFLRAPGSNPAKLNGMSSEVAPGVHRVGNAFVNCYLIEDGNHLTLVDAGMPGFRSGLDEYLRVRGRSVRDIAAVIVTHAHGDHIGMAEGVRVDAPAPVYVHEADAHMARTGKVHKREGSVLPYLRHRAALKLFAMGARNGGLKPAKVGAVETFTDGDLDVPGHPRVIATPGHSPGHVAFHLPDRGVLIAGDALCSYNPLTGRRGPQLMPKAFAANIPLALASLDALAAIDAGTLLFGHGEPWTDGPASAVAHAREVGVT
jgi:glyoxylase-like metal-dependent hydrolase (beta-lactamase superfamily II)